MITKLGDAQENYEAWKEVRKGYLSSSEMYTWLGDVESWWSDRPEDVLAGKQGVEKTFDSETTTTIAHGSFDESSILQKFGWMVGCDVSNENGFYHNDRFPGIGASLDGFGRPWDYEGTSDITDAGPPEIHAELSQDRTLAPYLRDYIDTMGVPFITEVKKSLSAKWQKEVPKYYELQVKTQLAVMEMPFAIIMAETVKKGETQKWRQFHDFRAYVIERDPAWDRVLLDEGAKFLDSI